MASEIVARDSFDVRIRDLPAFVRYRDFMLEFELVINSSFSAQDCKEFSISFEKVTACHSPVGQRLIFNPVRAHNHRYDMHFALYKII